METSFLSSTQTAVAIETRTFLFSTDPHLFTIETKTIPLLYSGSYPLTVLSRASAHVRSQLKPQKIKGGSLHGEPAQTFKLPPGKRQPPTS